MKIVFLTYIYPYPERGFNPGIERVVQEFARELANQGHDVHVVTTYRNGGDKAYERDGDVHIYRVTDTRYYLGRLGSLGSLDLFSLNYSFSQKTELLESADIVHTFTPIIWKWFKTPLVAHYHHWDKANDPIEYLHLPTNHRLWLRCYDLADSVVAVSEYSANDLVSRGIDQEKISVVYNGVDTDTYHPGPSQISFSEWRTVLLYVGPLMERKGLKYLIRAMPAILADHPETGLVIIGGGDKNDLVQLAMEIGVNDYIRFEGFVEEDQLPDYYRAADIFVFPSLLEGFGMVLVEAMASGLPVVSTTATAIPEVVGDVGRLVPPEESGELAAAVSASIHDSEDHSEEALKRVSNNFTWFAVAEQLYRVYRGITE